MRKAVSPHYELMKYPIIGIVMRENMGKTMGKNA